MAKSRLKVYGGNYNGKIRLIAAAASKSEFMRLTGMKGQQFSETRNPTELDIAIKYPGVVFSKKYNPVNSSWQKWEQPQWLKDR